MGRGTGKGIVAGANQAVIRAAALLLISPLVSLPAAPLQCHTETVDGAVNVTDISAVLPPHFGTSSPDLTGDGVVNILDVTRVLNAWSQPWHRISVTDAFAVEVELPPGEVAMGDPQPWAGSELPLWLAVDFVDTLSGEVMRTSAPPVAVTVANDDGTICEEG